MNQKSRASGKGEIGAWFTAVGLSLGLIVIAALLGVIGYNGLSVFWPKRVVQVEFDPQSAPDLGDRSVVAGIVTSQHEKPQESVEEWQLFLGNKDQYGISHTYLDRRSLLKVTRPEELLVLERGAYGKAIGYPEHISGPNGPIISSEHPDFTQQLASLVEEFQQRGKEIRELEYREIGAIHEALENLRLQQLRLERQSEFDAKDGETLERIKRERSNYQSLFTTLATRARSLRDLQISHKMHYRLASGEHIALPIGEIYHFFYPNQIGFWERVAVFWNRIVDFLLSEPREGNTEGGVFPAIFGTFVMTLFMSVIVTPFGVLAALYLCEYAKDGLFVRVVRIAINNLAGVPSIVFGVFGLGFFVYLVGGTLDQLFFSLRLPTPTFGTGGILWASLTLALMTVPVVIVATEEALSAVDRSLRESSMACGASKWQTIQRIVLPASAPGVLTGMILAMARGAGEVAPLMLVGVVKIAPSLPLDDQFPFLHLDRKFMHLGFHIYDLGFQSPDSEAALPMVFATTLLLIVLVVVLNLAAILIRSRLKRKYQMAGL